MPPARKPAPAKRGPKGAPGRARSGGKKTVHKLARGHAEDLPRKLVERPPHRRLFVDRGPAWLVLEPHRLGLVAAAFFTLLAALFYLLRSSAGASFSPGDVLVGAMSTFVVSYAAVGLFVWYVLLVADREFGPQVAPEKKKRSLVESEKKSERAGTAAEPHESPAVTLGGAVAPAEPQPEETS